MRDTITLIGTIGTDPALQTSDDGRPFLNFRLVTNHSWQDNKTHEYVDGEPNWFTVKAFRTLAVNTHASVDKGQRVIVHGRLQVRNWVNGDRSGTQVEVMADHIGHDLSLGTAKYSRMRAPDGGRQATGDQPPAGTAESGSGGGGAVNAGPLGSSFTGSGTSGSGSSFGTPQDDGTVRDVTDRPVLDDEPDNAGPDNDEPDNADDAGNLGKPAGAEAPF